MKIRNLINRNGYPARNQYLIESNGCYYFQSYESNIAMYNPSTKEVFLTNMWDYSKTTKKHLCIFLEHFNIPFVTNLPCGDNIYWTPGMIRESLANGVFNISTVDFNIN